MSATVLALHGYTQHGKSFSLGVRPLSAALPPGVSFEFPDAPHTCPEESLASFYASLRAARPEPPHRAWWRASEDGQVYAGWEDTLELVTELMQRHTPIGVLGFSQGAILATLVAALSARGELPLLRFAVLIAGSAPRALALAPLLEAKIRIPSLHVWGRRDALCATRSPALVERFEAGTCHTLVWPGAHAFPTRGFPVQAIAAFIAGHSA
jgi:predicted esterase